jgi:hypothetical protein
MSSTLMTEINGVRSMLSNPLLQAPTIKDIVEELEAVYQENTNLSNNTGLPWQVNSFTLTATAGQRTYILDPDEVTDFYKALTMTTVPTSDSTPEYTLEFVEIEHLPEEWAWLSQNQGVLLDAGHSSHLAAFYRKMGTLGEEITCELRPTPNSTQQYTVWYQVGDWWDRVFDNSDTAYIMPNKEYRFYFRALAARNLLPKAQWSFGQNADQKNEIKEMLDRRIALSKKVYDDGLAAIDNAGIVRLESWADTVDPYEFNRY